MEPSDLALFQPNLERAMDKTSGSDQASWMNRTTSHGGQITAGGDAGHGCRKFTHEFSDHGKKKSYVGVACKQADGSWKVKS